MGGYFGGRLAQAGEDVTFIARGEHLRAIRANGLRVDSTSGDFVVHPAQATDNVAEVGRRIVLFSASKHGKCRTRRARLNQLLDQRQR